MVLSACVAAVAEPPDRTLGYAEDAVCALPSPVGPLTYMPGRGLRVGETRLTLGGYSNVNLVRDEGGPATLKWDDLSLFVIWDPAARLHLFSELEFENILQVDDHGRGGTADNVFTTERLYADLVGSEQLNLRLGKFLTPVGRWNVIHAQPLVWTTSRPLATLLPFDPHVTGAMLFGALAPRQSNITYSVYGQFVNELDRPAESPRADHSAGLRLEYAGRGEWALGSSYLAFTQADHWQHLGGIDGVLRQGPLELMGEAVVEDASGGLASQWGFYLQTVLQVLSPLYLVGRYEHFDQRAPDPEVNLVVVGLAYKPVSFAVFKVEYLAADHRAEASPPGFKSSAAVLF